MKAREKAVSLLSYHWSLFSDHLSVNTGLRAKNTRKAALIDANQALNNAPNIKAYCYWREVVYILENC